MNHEVRFAPLAEADLISLHEWVEEAAGAEIADAYQQRLQDRCLSLGSFPRRGAPRHDIAAGVRSLSFERRIVIFYREEYGVITVLRIVSGAREQGWLVD